MKNKITSLSTILLVDDDVDLLDNIKDVIEEHFGKVIALPRAQAALELLKTTPVDCIVTDYKMPEMNGLEFIQALQKNHPLIPVILLTGNGSNTEVLQALEEGSFDYLDKPFKVPVLLNRIRNSLLLPHLENLILTLGGQKLNPRENFLLSGKSSEDRLDVVDEIHTSLGFEILNSSSKKSA